MNIAFKMFHLDDATDRDKYLSVAKSVFADWDEFNTPTFKISNLKDLQDFVNKNQWFNFDNNGYSLDSKQGWRYGELGIWASNLTAWKSFADSKYEYLVLMEDDLVCSPELPKLIEKYIKECPPDFHGLYIFFPEDQTHKYKDSLNVSENLCIAYQDWSSACYVIKKDTIKKMIDVADQGINLPLDWFSFRQKHLFNIYTLRPDSMQACYVEKIESTFQTTQEREIINGILRSNQ